MARFELSGTTALTAGTAKTVVRFMSPSSRKATLRAIEVVDGEAAAGDLGILARVLTGGTDGTGTSATPLPLNGAAASLGTAKVEYTVEPTGTTEVERFRLPAGGGNAPRYEGEEGIEIPHSSAIALELTAAEARAANVVSWKLIYEI